MTSGGRTSLHWEGPRGEPSGRALLVAALPTHRHYGRTDRSMTDTIDFAAQAQLVRRLAEHTGEEQLDAPTPCGEYAVRHLLGHLVGLTGAFRDAARKHLGPTTSTPPTETRPEVTAGWREDLARNL